MATTGATGTSETRGEEEEAEVEDNLRFLKRHRDVWWATGREIAEHWIERETGSRPR